MEFNFLFELQSGKMNDKFIKDQHRFYTKLTWSVINSLQIDYFSDNRSVNGFKFYNNQSELVQEIGFIQHGV